MDIRKAIFLAAGELIRSAPAIRGKVRLGQILFRLLRLPNRDLPIDTRLFPECLPFRLNLRCAHERMAYLMGQYEEATSRFLASIFRGGVFLDIGANIGLIAIPFVARTLEGRAGAEAYVYAIEALPSNFRALCGNVAANAMGESVRCLNVGLGAAVGPVSIQIEGDDPAYTGTANILPSGFEFNKIPLQLDTLDNLIATDRVPRAVTLIKIDTDGYDFEILKGAPNMLQTIRPVILAELAETCLGWHGQNLADVAEFLHRFDYELWLVTSLQPPRLRPFVRGVRHLQDCLLIPAERRAALPETMFDASPA